MSATVHTAPPSDRKLSALPIAPARDMSGNVIFSAGDAGAAHVMAHRLFDQNRWELGRRWLGRWLEHKSGWGSDWIHLEFHMSLFEIATGRWDAAYARFLEEIAPAAETTELALTDAPALAWKLALEADAPVDLPWESLRSTALRRMKRPADAFVTLHNLLALAGARDVESLRQWLRARPPIAASGAQRVVAQMARALIASINGNYGRAADRLGEALPRLSSLGASHAQNQLFVALESTWRHLSNRSAAARVYAQAA